METSVLVARTIAVVWGVMGLGILLNSAYFEKAFEDIYKSRATVFYGGVLALAFGFVIVSLHNVWVWDLPVVVTLFGWAALLKGLMLLLVPEVLLKFSKPFLANLKVVGVGALIFGLVLGYFAYFA
ncbi:hypothetical protein KJ632_01075 [Patescibacteria group bacterium]|nr:hypothetical protein [Patescibacteria group bacterium]